MANHKSSIKRIRQTLVRTERNRFYRTRLKNIVKDVNSAVEAGNKEEAQAALGAMDAGIIQAWKDAADTTVYVIATMEGENAIDAHGTALSIFGTLPMFQSGHLIMEEARSVVPYRDWATYLANKTS